MEVMAKFAWVVLLAACGGSGSSGDALLSGEVSGEFAGEAFAPGFGFATRYEGSPLIGISEDGLGCGSEQMASPPDGRGVIVSDFTFAVGAQDAFIRVFGRVDGNYAAFGSTGSIEITSITDDSITGTVDFDQLDDEELLYSAHGTFEIVNCGI